jgi:hypothetical protein
MTITGFIFVNNRKNMVLFKHLIPSISLKEHITEICKN